MIRLIASDVDGTLIKDSTPDLYPEMADTIRKLKERGILFCAASGRQYASLKNVFREVAEDIAYIAENGAHIRYRHKDISVTPMKREDIEGIMTMLRPHYGECEAVISTPAGSLIESKDQDFLDLLTYGYHNNFRQVEDVLAREEEIIKIAVYRKGSIRSLGESLFIPSWQDKVKACMAGEEWVDFMDRSVDKGRGLQILAQTLGIRQEEVMAFGDNDNDIGMMLAAGISYAVETAVPKVKEAAGRICPGWAEKGVYQVISRELF
ncbi:MAG: HAD family phosphatase [Lachnospiraceae bacterium]|jgi:Cof subfamily protein (haloacid dehalogenase superfamily)|nr:HAD family phosphatase [Lachnospiraceae bacterium]MCI9204064.1 HAD family phosphatase [Lachnospiraceae bacterium]MCI9333431.1 HAD family phosphatase [Lachnospiraceae bacterium]